MAKRSYPLSRVYGRLEPGAVLLLTTAHTERANVMTMSWHHCVPRVSCKASGRRPVIFER
jgi:hypothetical protein